MIFFKFIIFLDHTNIQMLHFLVEELAELACLFRLRNSYTGRIRKTLGLGMPFLFQDQVLSELQALCPFHPCQCLLYPMSIHFLLYWFQIAHVSSQIQIRI